MKQKDLTNDEIVIELNPSISQDLSSYLNEKLQNTDGFNVILKMDSGDYHFYPENAREEYLTMSNNDNGNKKIAFPFFNLNSVRLKGDNADLTFHGGIIPFVIKNVNKVEVSGINIYWDKPFTFEGEVIANSQSDSSFTLDIHEDNDYEIRDGHLYFTGYDWELPLGENIVYEKESRRPYFYTSHYEHEWHGHELLAEEMSSGVVRFSGVNANRVPPIGSIWVDKGPHSENRNYPAIFINESSNVNIKQVNVYACGAMGLIAEKSTNISLSNFNVTLPEGSKRMIGVTADATHFVNCRGLIKMDSCLFENMLDDATNIQGTYMIVEKVLDEHTIRTKFGHFQQEGFPFASAGDTLRLVSRMDLLPIKQVTVDAVRMDSENDYKISFNEKISDIDLTNVVVENTSYVASVRIQNCTIRQNRARSLLVSTSKTVEIYNNYFSSMMAGIRICGDANYWFESGPVSKVLIKGNVFEDLGVGGHNPQAILQIDPIIGKKHRGNGYYHKNIVFSDNEIKTFDRLLVYALSVDGLSITDNKIFQTDSFKEIYPELAHFDLQNCKNVIISGNQYTGEGEAQISVKNCEEVQVEEQPGFSDILANNPNKYFYQN